MFVGASSENVISFFDQEHNGDTSPFFSRKTSTYSLLRDLASVFYHYSTPKSPPIRIYLGVKTAFIFILGWENVWEMLCLENIIIVRTFL